MGSTRGTSRGSVALGATFASEFAITAAAWSVIAAVAVGLRMVAQFAGGGYVVMSQATMDVWMIAQWAVATPFVLRSARRFPIRGPRAIRSAAVHLMVGSAFIIASNVIIRLPMLWSASHGVRGLLSSTAIGLAIYYPAAIISYGVLVAIGHRLFAGPESPPMENGAKELEPSRLVIREWNRVHFIALDEIEWIEADNNNVVVHATTRTYKGRERISDVESRLDARRFIRVHRSAIVHRSRIREVQPLARGDQAVILQSGRVVRVARARRRALEDALGTEL